MANEQQSGVPWDQLGSFERYDKLALKGKGESAVFTMEDDGRKVDAALIESAMKAKGTKGVKARDSYVFIVNNDGSKKELWVGANSFTNLRELAGIRERNHGSLKGARVKATRIAVGDPSTPNMKFESA